MAKSVWEKAKAKYRELKEAGKLDGIEDVPEEVEEKARKTAKNLMKYSKKSDK